MNEPQVDRLAFLVEPVAARIERVAGVGRASAWPARCRTSAAWSGRRATGSAPAARSSCRRRRIRPAPGRRAPGGRPRSRGRRGTSGRGGPWSTARRPGSSCRCSRRTSLKASCDPAVGAARDGLDVRVGLELLELLGVGAMGVVELARLEGLDHRVGGLVDDDVDLIGEALSSPVVRIALVAG